jgi:hypothetical protein
MRTIFVPEKNSKGEYFPQEYNIACLAECCSYEKFIRMVEAGFQNRADCLRWCSEENEK